MTWVIDFNHEQHEILKKVLFVYFVYFVVNFLQKKIILLV